MSYAKLLLCLERTVGRPVSRVYEWPERCRSYYMDICNSPEGQRSFICKSAAEILDACDKHFQECYTEAYDR
ncbi:MAG: hypothetical protein QXI84_09270 [Thermofilaceae archaeon]